MIETAAGTELVVLAVLAPLGSDHSWLAAFGDNRRWHAVIEGEDETLCHKPVAGMEQRADDVPWDEADIWSHCKNCVKALDKRANQIDEENG